VPLPSRLGIDNPTGVLVLPSGELVVSGGVGDGSLA
jgi:hypothetical protein